MKRYLLLLLLLPFLTACENTWDSDARDMFVQGCMSAAKKDNIPEDKAKVMCDCRLEKAMKKHPNFSEAMDHIQDIIQDPAMRECEPK
ncbi:MAG: hypothetical protein KDC07_05820 [Chitinophagaceae bacterium]|nr:hypothetical protein [Chitinophagaceae bacterium]MCB9044607.1 hypothetical protein [Chitinophagales bacterium]